jgi:hypothetical protein
MERAAGREESSREGEHSQGGRVVFNIKVARLAELLAASTPYACCWRPPCREGGHGGGRHCGVVPTHSR